MAKNKETTTDELAMMVQKGFQGMDEKMDKRFDQLDNRFDQVAKRFDKAEGEVRGVKDHMAGLESRMDTMVKQIDNLQRGQVRIEDRLDEISPQIKEQKEIIKDHGKRLTTLEKKVALA